MVNSVLECILLEVIISKHRIIFTVYYILNRSDPHFKYWVWFWVLYCTKDLEKVKEVEGRQIGEKTCVQLGWLMTDCCCIVFVCKVWGWDNSDLLRTIGLPYVRKCNLGMGRESRLWATWEGWHNEKCWADDYGVSTVWFCSTCLVPWSCWPVHWWP